MNDLKKISQFIRYLILTATTHAESGHPTSSLSATDLMVALMFGGYFHADLDDIKNPNNDCLIFSKGHASPLFYGLYAAAGKVSMEEMMLYRKFKSPLEGHPTMAFPYTEAATGSLGQGLSIAVGIGLSAKYIDKLPYKTFVLLGDSEMTEGSQWEAMQIASHYKLDNVIGILDVNHLGQRGETMQGYNLKDYEKKISAFGWQTIVVKDGHSFGQLKKAYQKALKPKGKPVMIIAKTVKGKGVSFLENQEGWHGKALKKDELSKALLELGEVDLAVKGTIDTPKEAKPNIMPAPASAGPMAYQKNEMVATRKAYGNALVRIFPEFPNMVVLDAEVSNSTYAQTFKKSYPDRFFEMYIAEQNMVGAAVGLSSRGKLPFVSTFAAFFSRAFDQIRMSQYSKSNIKFIGSHAGVSIGQDGPSQMGLEDIAMFRTLLDSVVLYPADAVSTEKLVEESARHQGIVYIRTTRKDTPVIYDPAEQFTIGKCKILRQSPQDIATVVAAGVTLHEALAAFEELQKENIKIRVIDLYSIKPIDAQILKEAAKETKLIITVEDHFAEGGISEAVKSALADCPIKIISLAVRKMPMSGSPEELLDYEEISKESIIKAVKNHETGKS